MSAVKGGIVVSGTIDGTTIVYHVRAITADGEPASMTQYYDTAKVVPDWKSLYESGDASKLAMLPRLIITAVDTSTGVDVTKTVNITEVFYGFAAENAFAVSFDDDGISRAPIEGLLKRTTYNYDGTNIPCVMIIGNPADPDYNNPDDDRITFNGTVVSSGGQASFNGIGKDLQIRPIVNANVGYEVVLEVPDDTPSYIMTDENNVKKNTKRRAKLYYNGYAVETSSMTGYSFKFFDITGPDEVELKNTSTDISIGTTQVTGDTITIGADAVDCMLTLRCKVFDADNKELASGTSVVYDLSDPYSLTWKVADDAAGLNGVDITGGINDAKVQIRRAQTKYFIPRIVTDKGTIPGTITWTFNADDANTGETISGLPGVPSSSGQTHASLRYEDVVLTDDNGNKYPRPIMLHAQSSEF